MVERGPYKINLRLSHENKITHGIYVKDRQLQFTVRYSAERLYLISGVQTPQGHHFT